MKLRQFLGALATGGVGAALAQPSVAAESPTPPPPPKIPLVRTPLVLMAPRADGLEAVWAVGRLAKGRLEWETADGAKGVVAADAFGFVPQSDEVLRVRLMGFAPGTSLRVRAVTTAADDSETVTSDWKSVRTLSPTAREARFVMWNDTHIHDETIKALHAATPASDFLLWNGDTCNDWTFEHLLVPTLLHPGGCDMTARCPMFLTWGNHDVRGAHAFRAPGLVAAPEGRPFYAFRSGPVAVICLHTGEDKPDDHPSFRGRVAFDALRAEQARWLAEVIRRPEFRDAPYRVVFCHIPLRWKEEKTPDYANGGYDYFSGRSRATWHDSLVAWKAQVVLSGHTHEAAWLPPTDAFPYAQITGGGPKMESATLTEAVADATSLRIKLTNLQGKVVVEQRFSPQNSA